MRSDHAALQELGPAETLVGLPFPVVEADDLAAAQAASEADQQDGAVAQAGESGVEGADHGDDVGGQHRAPSASGAGGACCGSQRALP